MFYLKGISSNKACTFISPSQPSHHCSNAFKSPANPVIIAVMRLKVQPTQSSLQ
jgi:hypothetical protein